MTLRDMIASHPDVRGSVNQALVDCLRECAQCAQTCLICADACLAEDMVGELKQCIRFDLDCADVCAATGALGVRRTGSNEALLRSMIETCALACRLCAEECERHAGMHDHCRLCAEECRRCEQSCRAALKTF